MRRLLLPLLLLPLVLTAQIDLQLETFVSGFSDVTDLATDGQNDDLLYVVEKAGRIRIVLAEDGADPTVMPQVFLDIDDRVSNGGGEQGLLGLAFSPDFATDGAFFVNYTRNNGDTRISRFVRNAGTMTADPASEQILLTYSQPFGNHNGGDLAFGPDNHLYIASGDGGSGGDPQNNSQNRTNLLGKILRLDVLSAPGQALIPSDNPFADDADTADEIWALGLRNPWRISFDRETGDLWMGDVGQNEREEVNRQPADSPGGENYGWRCYEGNQPFNLSGCPDDSELTFPVHTYVTNSTNPGCSVTGGFVYRGCDYPALFGRYIYADFCSGRIWSLTPDGNGGYDNEELFNGPNFQYGTFGEFRGELYIAEHGNGIIRKITDANAQPINLNGVVMDETCADQTDGSITLDVDANTTGIEWSNGATGETLTGLNGGTYAVTVTLETGCTITRSYIVETGLPDAPIIDLNIDTQGLSVEDIFSSYQWVRDGVVIPGATDPDFQPTESGVYTVVVTNTDGCELTANGIEVIISGTNELPGLTTFAVTPNPFTDQLIVDFSTTEPQELTLQLLDLNGRLRTERELGATTDRQLLLPTADLPRGVYFVRLFGAAGSRTVRVVK